MSRKILITSIPCWNQQTGSNTLSSLFDSFDSACLANIYIGAERPDSTVCSRYFRIKEWQVVKSVFCRKVNTGEVVTIQDEISYRDLIAREPHRSQPFFMKRRRIFLWLRELAWKIGKWRSKELDAFVKDFNPEVLFFPIESYPYFNRINKYLIETYRPKKVVGYFWDDNFTYKQHPRNLLHKIERFFLRKQVKKIVGLCTDILAISPKTKAECDSEFGIKSIVITKPVTINQPFVPYTPSYPINILYTGKLNIGRDKTLCKVIDTMVNAGVDSTKLAINVYTNTVIEPALKSYMESSGICIFHDSVPQSVVFELQGNADVLLFMESLDDTDLTARLSFSTKLTDYFAAAKCIWAIGNADLGPISYLISERAGLVSCSEKEIIDVSRLIIETPEVIPEYAERAYLCGLNNHNKMSIIDKLHTTLES